MFQLIENPDYLYGLPMVGALLRQRFSFVPPKCQSGPVTFPHLSDEMVANYFLQNTREEAPTEVLVGRVLVSFWHFGESSRERIRGLADLFLVGVA